MGQALYRKYRSRSLSEIVGQKPITTALENAIKNGHISHAYLFTGPRGTGKTSVARILAFNINGIPYDSENLPLDIIEIDAASNRRIDEIRDLRDKVNIAPVSAKYKVYIIDEVHMLTREAFNALLKTLEEPPQHVVFILATTEAHKLPDTIVSRTQHYSFKLATTEQVVSHLKYVAKQESIKIDKPALELLAKHSGGSMRDALSLLDQVRHTSTNITTETVRSNLGLPDEETVKNILNAVQSSNASEVISAVNLALETGATASLLATMLLKNIRENILSKKLATTPAIVELMQGLVMVDSSNMPKTQLELVLIAAQLAGQPPQPAQILQSAISAPTPALTFSAKNFAGENNDSKKPKPEVTTALNEPNKSLATKTDDIASNSSPQTAHNIAKNSYDVQIVSEPPVSASGSTAQSFNEQTWASTLESIRQDHSTLYSILRMATPVYDQNGDAEIRLLFKFPFHQKRISEAHNKQCLLDCLAVNGVEGYEIVCDVLPKETTNTETETATASISNMPADTSKPSDINQIRSVFGGAEVLE